MRDEVNTRALGTLAQCFICFSGLVDQGEGQGQGQGQGTRMNGRELEEIRTRMKGKSKQGRRQISNSWEEATVTFRIDRWSMGFALSTALYLTPVPGLRFSFIFFFFFFF